MMLENETNNTLSIRVIIFTLIFLFIPGIVSAHSQILSLWFIQNQYSDPYRIVETELHQVFEEVEDLGIPPRNLIEKINEGVSKRIQPLLLLSALRDEAARLKTAQIILSSTTNDLFKEDVYVSLLKEISIFLLGGIEEKNIREFITLSIHKDPDLVTFLILGRTLLSILSITDISAENQLLLGESLLSGDFSISGYPSISSLFLKGKLKRLESEEIISIIVNSLKNGDGIIRMNNEINRRGKSR